MPDGDMTEKFEFISSLSSLGHAMASYLLADPIGRAAFFAWMRVNGESFEDSVKPDTIPDDIKDDLKVAQEAFERLRDSADSKLSPNVIIVQWSPNLSSSRSSSGHQSALSVG